MGKQEKGSKGRTVYEKEGNKMQKENGDIRKRSGKGK